MKIKRSTIIDLHLYFSGTSTFILLLFIISGSLHLFGFKETKDSHLVKEISINKILSKDQLELLFKTSLREQKPSYEFDYIKAKNNTLTTRPTTREFYTFEQSKKSISLINHKPNFTMRLMEFHKGHGPKSSKKIVASIAIIFALSVLTGVWLGLTVKKYRRIIVATSMSGLILLLLLFSI